MIYKLSAAAAMLATAFASHAALVHVDDYTLDTSTGLEWLDLQLTHNVTLYDVFHGYGGYVANGWQSAGIDQVDSLFFDAGAIIDPTAYHTQNVAPVNLLATLLNGGNTDARGSMCGSGYTGQTDDEFGECLTAGFDLDTGSPLTGYVTDFDGHLYPQESAGPDNFLVRAAPVPEPSEYALMLAGLAGVVGFARRKRRG